jgi:VWFA-related protein
VVRVPVWVTGRGGLAVTGLTAGDFHLFVAGRPVPIESCLVAEDRPLELVYMVDLSGSMAIGGKVAGSAEAISYLLDRHQPEDIWRVIAFSDGQILEILNQKTVDEWPALKGRLRGYGKTALFDALSISDRYFAADHANNRALLLFTDGNDNQSLLSREQLMTVLRVINVPVFIVAIADGFIPASPAGEEALGIATLKEIAETTGGSVLIAKSTADLPGLVRTLSQKLRPQYLLTFTVEQGAQDGHHDIALTLEGHRYADLRYRRGYTGHLP